jgi:hypothetical protein
VVIALAILLTDLVQLWWFGRRSNPDHGPRSRAKWERVPADQLTPGDVVLSSTLSPNPETVVIIAATDDGRLDLTFRSGRSARVAPSQPVRRHRPT